MVSYSLSGVTARAESVSTCHVDHVVQPGPFQVSPVTVAAYEIEPYVIVDGTPVSMADRLVCQSYSRLSSRGDPTELAQDPLAVQVPYTYRWSGFDLRPVGSHGPLSNYGGISVNTQIQWGPSILKRSGVNTTLGWMQAGSSVLSPDCTVVTVAMIRGTNLPLLMCDSTSARSGLTVISSTTVALAQNGIQAGSSALAPTTKTNIPVVLVALIKTNSVQVLCIDGQGLHYGAETPVNTATSLAGWMAGKDPTYPTLRAPAVIFEVILLDRLMTPQEFPTLLALAASYGVH